MAAPATPEVALADLIVPNALFAMRSRADLFLPLLYIKPLLGEQVAPCWTELAGKLVAAWQVQVPGTPHRESYFILEGAPPRDKVVSCLPGAVVKFDIRLREVDELLEIAGNGGSAAYAAWRGNYIIVGPYDLVAAAIAPNAERSARWAALVGPHPDAPIYAGAVDDTLSKIVGAATTMWQVSLDRIDRTTGSFAGKIVAMFATSGDAAITARRIKQGELALPPDSPELVDAFKRMTVKQDRAVVTIHFDSAMFGGVAPDVLLGFATSILVGT